MRVAFLVNRDIESALALSLLRPVLAAHEVSVFVSEQVGSAKGPKPAAMLGQLSFVEQDLWNHVVFPALDATPRKARYKTLDGLEREFGFKAVPLASARTPEALDSLAASGADLFVSIRFGKILGSEAIALPRFGVLNLHSGILPNYRGVLATFRALMNGDSEIGCTLHRIDKATIDTGPVIEIGRREVDRSKSLLWHVLSLYPTGAQMIQRAIERIAAGDPVRGDLQRPDRGTYFSFPTDADLVAFTAAGWRIFDRLDVADLLRDFGVGEK